MMTFDPFQVLDEKQRTKKVLPLNDIILDAIFVLICTNKSYSFSMTSKVQKRN